MLSTFPIKMLCPICTIGHVIMCILYNVQPIICPISHFFFFHILSFNILCIICHFVRKDRIMMSYQLSCPLNLLSCQRLILALPYGRFVLVCPIILTQTPVPPAPLLMPLECPCKSILCFYGLIHLSSIYLSFCLSVYLSIYLSIFLSVLKLPIVMTINNIIFDQ